MIIENALIVKIDIDILTRNNRKICSTIESALHNEGLDVDVYTFILEETSDLIIDYEFSIKNKRKIEGITKYELENMKIRFTIE